MEAPFTRGSRGARLPAETLDGKVDEEVEKPGEEVELEAMERAADDLLCAQEELGDPITDRSVEALTISAAVLISGGRARRSACGPRT